MQIHPRKISRVAKRRETPRLCRPCPGLSLARITRALSAPGHVSSRSASLIGFLSDAGRAFRGCELYTAPLRQPCSRQASVISPGGAPRRPGARLRTAHGDAGRFPRLKTPHERALERKRRAELTRAAKRGDLFFRDFQKPLRSNEIFKYRKSDIPALTITGAEKETGRGCGPFDVNSASCPAFKSAIANTWMAGTSPAMTNKSYPAAVCGFTDCRFCESLFKALI
jgi:hypothetical protein